MKNNLHIVPHESRWVIRHAGSTDSLEEHDTQQAAIEAAVELAEDDENDIVVHRRDGTFRNVIRHETIEKRLAAKDDASPPFSRPLFWGLLGTGAIAGIATYLILRPPRQMKRLLE